MLIETPLPHNSHKIPNSRIIYPLIPDSWPKSIIKIITPVTTHVYITNHHISISPYKANHITYHNVTSTLWTLPYVHHKSLPTTSTIAPFTPYPHYRYKDISIATMKTTLCSQSPNYKFINKQTKKQQRWLTFLNQSTQHSFQTMDILHI